MYGVHARVHMCNFSPTETPLPPPPSSDLNCLNQGHLSQAQGLPGRAELLEPWATSGHAGGSGGGMERLRGGGEGEEGRGEGAQAWVGASPIPSLPFPTPTPATRSSAHLSPQGDPARGPFSHSSWSPGRPGPGSSSPPPLSPEAQTEGGKVPHHPVPCVSYPVPVLVPGLPAHPPWRPDAAGRGPQGFEAADGSTWPPACCAPTQ